MTRRVTGRTGVRRTLVGIVLAALALSGAGPAAASGVDSDSPGSGAVGGTVTPVDRTPGGAPSWLKCGFEIGKGGPDQFRLYTYRGSAAGAVARTVNSWPGCDGSSDEFPNAWQYCSTGTLVYHFYGRAPQPGKPRVVAAWTAAYQALPWCRPAAEQRFDLFTPSGADAPADPRTGAIAVSPSSDLAEASGSSLPPDARDPLRLTLRTDERGRYTTSALIRAKAGSAARCSALVQPVSAVASFFRGKATTPADVWRDYARKLWAGAPGLVGYRYYLAEFGPQTAKQVFDIRPSATPPGLGATDAQAIAFFSDPASYQEGAAYAAGSARPAGSTQVACDSAFDFTVPTQEPGAAPTQLAELGTCYVPLMSRQRVRVTDGRVTRTVSLTREGSFRGGDDSARHVSPAYYLSNRKLIPQKTKADSLTRLSPEVRARQASLFAAAAPEYLAGNPQADPAALPPTTWRSIMYRDLRTNARRDPVLGQLWPALRYSARYGQGVSYTADQIAGQQDDWTASSADTAARQVAMFSRCVEHAVPTPPYILCLTSCDGDPTPVAATGVVDIEVRVPRAFLAAGAFRPGTVSADMTFECSAPTSACALDPGFTWDLQLDPPAGYEQGADYAPLPAQVSAGSSGGPASTISRTSSFYRPTGPGQAMTALVTHGTASYTYQVPAGRWVSEGFDASGHPVSNVVSSGGYTQRATATVLVRYVYADDATEPAGDGSARIPVVASLPSGGTTR